MKNPPPRPSLLRKAGVIKDDDRDTFEVSDGFGNKIGEYSMDRVVMLPTAERLDLIVDQAQAELDSLADRWGVHGTGSGYVIDEVALLFRTGRDLDTAVSGLVRRPEWLHFNGADDHVKTEPFGTEYDVRYEFFSIEGRTYRVEAMALMGGSSPLHEAAMQHGVMEIHTSFKVADMRAYRSVVEMLSSTIMSGGDMMLGQACVSTYGEFSYWRKGSPEGPRFTKPWLKPRVNVRDGI